MSDYIKKYEPLWGAWKIENLIGEGSFGKVYKLNREEFGHKYEAALKLIRVPSRELYKEAVDSIGDEEDSLTQYFEEAVREIVKEIEVLYTLKGNNNIVGYEEHMIVPLESEIGWDILIKMEYVSSLKNYISENQMSRKDVIKFGIDICSALELCNSKGIIHRDIKEENIFVSGDGDFKLGDFGIAKKLSEKGYTVSKKGTPLYMAPEVYKDERYTFSVDIYSLGLVLYKLLNNGRLPFMPPYPQEIKYQDSQKALNKRLKGDEFEVPVNAGERLSKVVLKACAYKEDDRFLSPSEMKNELQKVLSIMRQQDKDEKVTLIQSNPSRNTKRGSSQNTTVNAVSDIDESTSSNKTYNQVPTFEKAENMINEEKEQSENGLSETLGRTHSIFSDNAKEDIKRPVFKEEPETSKEKIKAPEKKAKKRSVLKYILIGAFIIIVVIPFSFGIIKGIIGVIEGNKTQQNTTINNKQNNSSTNKTKMGNTSSNIVNNGIAAVQDGYIYYSNQTREGILCKSKIDGTAVMELSADHSMDINVLGDWVYYTNAKDGFLYKVKTDGSEKTKIGEEFTSFITVIGDWIYYINPQNAAICKMKIDGSNNAILSTDITENLSIDNGIIYYLNIKDRNKLYKMNIYGKDRVKLSDDYARCINTSGDWVYYVNQSDKWALYKVKKDGTSRTKIKDESILNINVVGDKIYYISYDDLKIYQINVDGSGKKVIGTSERASLLNVVGDWIYFRGADEDATLYKININGTRADVIK